MVQARTDRPRAKSAMKGMPPDASSVDSCHNFNNALISIKSSLVAECHYWDWKPNPHLGPSGIRTQVNRGGRWRLRPGADDRLYFKSELWPTCALTVQAKPHMALSGVLCSRPLRISNVNVTVLPSTWKTQHTHNHLVWTLFMPYLW